MSDAINGLLKANEQSEAEGYERFMAMFNQKYARYFEFLGGRTSGKGKARLRCKVCGHEFERFGNFARMDSNLFCPRCHVHRDDVISVPTDGKLIERVNQMYADGTLTEQIAEATGISQRYVRALIDDASRAAHDEAIKAEREDLRERRKEERRKARAAMSDAFKDVRQELAEARADKVLKAAADSAAQDFKCFRSTEDFINAYAPSYATCNHCGKDYLFFPNAKRYGRKKAGPYCTRRCRVKHNKSSSNIGHRLRKYGSAGKRRDAIKLDAVIERDNGICYICGRKTSREDRYYVHGCFVAGDTYPTVDHVIPLARGGTHTWDNVRLACRQCNSIKGDTPQWESKP